MKSYSCASIVIKILCFVCSIRLHLDSCLDFSPVFRKLCMRSPDEWYDFEQLCYYSIRTVESEMKAMQHSWGSLTRLTQDRQRWKDFAAALTPQRVVAGDENIIQEPLQIIYYIGIQTFVFQNANCTRYTFLE